jgi:AcrR family transcriptional regulator
MKEERDPARGDTADRLVVAAIEEIERHGLAKLTVRGVAQAAGVNIAAVNYHFRSKDALVAAALQGSIAHMVGDTDEFLARVGDDPERVLGELFAYYLEGAVRYPGMVKAHLHDAFIANDYSGPFPTLFAPVLARLADVVRRSTPGLDRHEAAHRVTGALSAIFFPSFFGGFFAPLETLATANDRITYAQDIARWVLSPARPSGKSPRKHR